MDIETAIILLEQKKREYAKKALQYSNTETGFKYLVRLGACGLGVENLKRRQQNGS